MIRISRPYLRSLDESVRLCADITHEGWGTQTLWYAVSKEYANSLCNEYADAFLVALLPIAIRTGKDIVCEGSVSSKLLFNIQNSIQFLHRRVQKGCRPINISVSQQGSVCFASRGVGCGCSLGVDSLASIWKHFNPNTQQGYRITHLALFNCGQMGDSDNEAAERYFNAAMRRAQSFAEELGLPIVSVDSNINQFYAKSDVGIVASVNMRTLSCAMALQKLFGKYIFASSYRLDQIKFVDHDEELLEGFIVPQLSTDNMEIVLSCADMTRVEKEAYIDEFDLTHKYLNVCCAEQMAYSGGGNLTRWLDGKQKMNCGWCDKCMRTLLAYEVLGRLDPYKDIFDLMRYNKHKALYIRHAFVNDKVKPFAKELVELMLKNDYPIPWAVKIQYVIKQLARKIQEGINYTSYRIVRRLNRGCARY